MKFALFFIGLIFYALLVWWLKKRRLWLPYYALAVFGLTFIFVFLAREAHFDTFLSFWEMNQAHFLARWLKISTQVVSSGSIAIKSSSGWSILSIGLECSALLELSILVGLILFYPAFKATQKITLLIIGFLGTYLINLLRILLIITLVAVYGPTLVFVAHAVIGRLFFFTAVIVLYWYLITLPTLNFLGEEVKAR